MISFKPLLIAFVCLLLSACSSFPPPRTIDNSELLWQTRQNQLKQIQQWQIQGRTAITQDKEAINAGLRWLQDQDDYHIQLLGPFAQGGVSLEGNQQGVTLTLADGQQVKSTSPDALLEHVLQWQLPIEALHDWVRGLPYSLEDYQELQLDQQGRINFLSQQGWQIKFLRYIPFDGHSMPSKIFITHPDISVKIVISSWNKLP